jgi:2-deoxy-D-gluconate 3-dehydrogenase
LFKCYISGHISNNVILCCVLIDNEEETPETMAAAASDLTSSAPILDLMSLKGQNALVTGGSRGIGAAIAVALAQAGASVCIAQRDSSNTATADTIRANGGRAKILTCDLSHIEEVKTVFDRALEVMGGTIDILVNCGGLLKRAPAVEVLEADWDYV